MAMTAGRAATAARPTSSNQRSARRSGQNRPTISRIGTGGAAATRPAFSLSGASARRIATRGRPPKGPRCAVWPAVIAGASSVRRRPFGECTVRQPRLRERDRRGRRRRRPSRDREKSSVPVVAGTTAEKIPERAMSAFLPLPPDPLSGSAHHCRWQTWHDNELKVRGRLVPVGSRRGAVSVRLAPSRKPGSALPHRDTQTPQPDEECGQERPQPDHCLCSP